MSIPARQSSASASASTTSWAKYQGGALTDERGIAQLHIWYDARNLMYMGLTAVLDSPEHFGIGYTRWSEGMGRWDANRPDYYALGTPIQTYLYTDRPVYRPGQPVYFRGIVRSKDDVVYMPAPYRDGARRLSRTSRRLGLHVVEKTRSRSERIRNLSAASSRSRPMRRLATTFCFASPSQTAEGEYGRYETDRLRVSWSPNTACRNIR